MLPLTLLSICISSLPIWMTVAQFRQYQQQHHQLSQASAIAKSEQSTARLRATSAQNRAVTAARIIPNTKEVHFKGNGEEAKRNQSSKQNIYQFQNTTEKAEEKLDKCMKPPSCPTHRGFYGYSLDEYSMVDTKKKILMEFSPKADCTAAVVALLEASGYEQNNDYFGWPHVFRESYYNPHCGHATYCTYYDPSWFRFKVVRNPFDRAVSSYLYVMKTNWLNEFLPAHIKRASFEGFINYLLTLPPDTFQYFCTRHAGPQSQYYERFVYIENKKMEEGNSTMKNPYPPVFHEIVKVENSQSAFERINRKTGIRYQLKYSSKTHFQSRNSNIHSFVGNLTWDELNRNQNGIPESYGYFYNEELKAKGERLYYWDLLLYNYTYPF